MSGLKFYSYPGFGEWGYENLNYRQAVRVGDTIRCSGQGGWDPHNKDVDFDTLILPDLDDEIDQAFINCDINLKHAGGKGWSQVYKVNTYMTDVAAQNPRVMYNFKKWMPDHKPIWNEIGVKELGTPKMRFELEVEAYDPEGAKAAKE